jgi:hypothetical protein
MSYTDIVRFGMFTYIDTYLRVMLVGLWRQ